MQRINGRTTILSGTKSFNYISRIPGAMGNSPVSIAELFFAHSGNIVPFELETITNEMRENFTHQINEEHVTEILESYEDCIGGLPNSIIDKRLIEGHSNGLIDLNVDALIKTDLGWKFHNSGELVARADASADAIWRVIIEKYDIKKIPFVSNEFLEEAEQTGELFIDGEPIAIREGDRWQLMNSNHSLAGPALRVLHHSDVECAFNNARPNFDTYHGAVMSNDRFQETGGAFEGFENRGDSVNGKGFYMACKNEAIKTYANPNSPERQLQREGLGLHYDRGVLHPCEIKGSAALFDCNFNGDGMINNTDAQPSPYVFAALAHEHLDNADTIQRVLGRALCRMGNATRNFEVFMAIKGFADDIYKETKATSERDILGKIVRSVGYDGIIIAPPSKKQMAALNDLSNQIKTQNGELFEYISGSDLPEKAIANHLASYLQLIRNSVPNSLDKGHVIIFSDPENVINLGEPIPMPAPAKDGKHILYDSKADLDQVSDGYLKSEFDYELEVSSGLTPY
ncbi:hypothetical protein [Vibrio owensii]|uniref:hypothetical protein n=1 Tax=Vibrio owensii TaxID=696485 RepID=UPI003CC67790